VAGIAPDHEGSTLSIHALASGSLSKITGAVTLLLRIKLFKDFSFWFGKSKAHQ
jgi:hypothetical protein